MFFGQIITAMVTPFDDQLQIDWKKTEKLIEHLITVQKTETLVVAGTTGETCTLSEEEKVALVSFATQQTKGRCKVIAGTGSNNTAQSIKLTEKIEQLGVDGILSVAPYYNKPNQAGLYQHFKEIAESTELPIILYNVPSRTAVNIEASTTVALSQLSNIVGIKECGSTQQMTKVISQTASEFYVYAGDDAALLPALAVGAKGVISVASHVIGKHMATLFQAFEEKDLQKSQEVYSACLPIFEGLFACPHPVPNPVAIKYILSHLGVDVGGVRLPLVEASQDEKEFLQTLVSTHPYFEI